jgi:hypothetical protein
MADKAFPTAYGAASQATGGRGYLVYKVTTLSPFGAGSISQAIIDAKASGGGNIVFDVSGIIQFNTAFLMEDLQNISILGQTAPQGGITITNASGCSSCRTQVIDSNNLIIRYIRFRPHFFEGQYDGLEFISSYNCIIDHHSLAWGSDEAISTRVFSSNPVYNITFQRGLIGESKTGSLMGYNTTPSLGYDQSTHKNIFVNCDHRFPNATSDGRMDIVNNIVYDWYSRLSVFDGDADINHVGNSYYLGHKTSLNMDDNGSGHSLMCITEGTTGVNMSVYSNDTFIEENYPAVGLDEGSLFYYRGSTDGYNNEVKADPTIQVGTMFPLLGDDVPVLSASANFTNVLADVGANAYIDDNGVAQRESDSLDVFYLNLITAEPQVVEYARAPSNNYNGFPVSTGDYLFEYYDRYIDFHAAVTSTPINTRPAGYDTNDDGISDAWATANMGGDSSTDLAPSGYEWREEYWNQVDDNSQVGDIPVITLTGASTINLNVDDVYTELGATANDTEDGVISPVIISGWDENTTASGTYFKYYNIQDSDNNDAVQVTRTIVISSAGNVEYPLTDLEKLKSKKAIFRLARTGI